jgi:hypothetical protein
MNFGFVVVPVEAARRANPFIYFVLLFALQFSCFKFTSLSYFSSLARP